MDEVLIEQLLTLEGERVREGNHPATSSSAASTHPVEHIGEPTNSSGLFDEWVAKDLVPLRVTVEVLRNRSSQRKTLKQRTRVPPTSWFMGVGTVRFGRNGLAFLPIHLWKGDAGVDKINNGLDAITPDKSLTVSCEGGPVDLVTKARTFPPPCAPKPK